MSHLDNAKLRNLVRRNRKRRQRDFGVRLPVVRKHPAVIHLVDVVAGENDHVLRLFTANRVDVLVNGVRRAHIPVGARPLHRRHQLKELPKLLRHNPRPPFANVPVQRQRLVLRQDVNLAQSRVDAIGQRDIDDAVMPAKRYGRLGPVASEWEQPLACPAGKQYT